MHSAGEKGIDLDERYDLGTVLAETENSVLLRGRELATDREVCIKLLKRSTAEADPESVHRFRREALTLSEIRCPSIVQVYEYGNLGGGPSIIMEMVHGQPLDEAIRQHDLSLIVILKMLRNIADGLAHIHRLGIVHRDIKPANILLVDNERADIRIIDFGFAALRAGTTKAVDGVAGTLRYMAPEQAGLICRPVGERADLYSLGCLAYELLAGVPPYAASTAQELLRSIQCDAPIAVRNYAPEVPVVLERIINKLLEKNPDDRYRSAESLQSDVQRLLVELESNRSAPIFEPDGSSTRRSQRIG